MAFRLASIFPATLPWPLWALLVPLFQILRHRLPPITFQSLWKEPLALRAAIVSAGGLYLPDRLHDVRIAAKKLRYALELVQSVGQIQMASRLKALRQTQDLLGRMHDVEMVIARIRTVQGTPGRANLRVSADLDCAVRALEDECRRHHGGYVAMREALLKLTDAVESGAAREVEA